MTIKYRYTVSDGTLILKDVPPRDLTDEDWKELSEELRARVADCSFYEEVGKKDKSVASTVPQEEEEDK